jgi:hypothetical protein
LTTLSEDDLLRIAAMRGWTMDRDRIADALPEVQRLLAAAARLRELPMEPDLSPGDPA